MHDAEGGSAFAKTEALAAMTSLVLVLNSAFIETNEWPLWDIWLMFQVPLCSDWLEVVRIVEWTITRNPRYRENCYLLRLLSSRPFLRADAKLKSHWILAF
jgi:hypothetical protein